MKRCVLMLLVSAALGACMTHGPRAHVEMHSLGGNKRLPSEWIRAFYSEKEWLKLRDTRYDGYVVLRVQIQKDRTVSNLRVLESYPDHSRDVSAVNFAKSTRLFAPRVASRTAPSGEVYVVFYESSTQRHALVFGKHLPGSSSVEFDNGDRYWKIYLY